MRVSDKTFCEKTAWLAWLQNNGREGVAVTTMTTTVKQQIKSRKSKSSSSS